MPVLDVLQAAAANAAAPWASLYADHVAVQTAVVTVHLGGMLLGGGVAVAADRQTLLAARAAPPDDATDARRRAIAVLRGAHRVVLVGLALSIATGLLLVAADVETYLTAPALWLKLGVLALLLANGAALVRAERRAADAHATADADADADAARTRVERAWRRLRRGAAASLTLWFTLVLLGVLLVNAPGLA
jgi:hypothetical protein